MQKRGLPKKSQLLEFAEKQFSTTDLKDVRAQALGMGGWRYRSFSKRVLLAGDATGFSEPLFGEGIYNAVKSGQIAARAMIKAEKRQEPAGTALKKELYEIRRDLLLDQIISTFFYKLPQTIVNGTPQVSFSSDCASRSTVLDIF